MLRMTCVELELITDTEMYLFVEKKSMRGGVFNIAKRYSKAKTLLKDTAKPIINTSGSMMIVRQVNILPIWKHVIFMVWK